MHSDRDVGAGIMYLYGRWNDTNFPPTDSFRGKTSSSSSSSLHSTHLFSCPTTSSSLPTLVTDWFTIWTTFNNLLLTYLERKSPTDVLDVDCGTSFSLSILMWRVFIWVGYFKGGATKQKLSFSFFFLFKDVFSNPYFFGGAHLSQSTVYLEVSTYLLQTLVYNLQLPCVQPTTSLCTSSNFLVYNLQLPCAFSLGYFWVHYLLLVISVHYLLWR